MADSDEDLVRRSQRGDRAAFEQLVRRTARLVYSRLFLEVGDTHRAEDLSQETFLTAWRSIAQVTDPSGFRTWLISIAHTVAIDLRRRERRKKRAAAGVRVDEQVLEAVEADDADPAVIAGANEQRRHVMAVLRGLPEEYRGPILLRYVAGADYQSIERELGMSNGALRGMLSRGIGMLRKRLGSTGA